MSSTYASSRFRLRSSGLVGCARERSEGYDQGSVGRSVPLPLVEDATATVSDEGLSEPAARVAGLLDLTDLADRTQLRLVETLISHRDTIQAHTGLPVDVVLSQQGRLTRSDRRMLLSAADMLAVLPQIRDAWHAGQMSWPQVRVVVAEAKRLPARLLERFDLTVAQAAGEYRDCEPDELMARVSQLVDALRPERDADNDRKAERGEFVSLQPNLDGGGGRIFGELGAVSFATIAEALTAGLDLSDLQPTVGPDGGKDPEAARHNMLTLGSLRAKRLVELAQTWLAGFRPPTDDPDEDGSAPRTPTAAARPTFFVSATLDALRAASNDPAALLTRLAGGRLRVSARTARKLVREFDVDVRLLLIDEHGDTIGVGRRHREPPGWLRDAVTAQFPTCTAPGCDRPSLTCDVDHHIDWHPGKGAGRTDLDNLAPACRPHHGAKTRAEWTITAIDTGDRIWQHRRSGLIVRKPPSHRQLTLLDLPPPAD